MNREILIVDDDVHIRGLLEKVLDLAGYATACAPSGEDALEIANQSNIQVYFLDMELPGMNGLELCREIRKVKPAAIVITITAQASVFDLVKCRETGFDDYFVKPLDTRLIVKAAEDSFEKLDRWRKRY